MSASTSELTDSITSSIATLCSDTDSARQSATYIEWLKTMSRFHSYSVNNSLLIAFQRPDATLIAGFNKWKAMKRFVRKGERGIRILAPSMRKAETEIAEGVKKTVTTLTGFRFISVFDYSQTDGEPLPLLAVNATEGGDTLLPRLEKAVASLNISLQYQPLRTAYGVSSGGSIVIDDSLDTPGRCGVVVHELAHELLSHQARKSTSTSKQLELEAESVAYVVLSHYGMKLPSELYLASYGITAEMLTASLQIISNTSKRIISLLEGDDAAVRSGKPEPVAETNSLAPGVSPFQMTFFSSIERNK